MVVPRPVAAGRFAGGRLRRWAKEKRRPAVKSMRRRRNERRLVDVAQQWLMNDSPMLMSRLPAALKL